MNWMNFMTWKRKLKILKINKIDKFKLYIKQFYLIVWSLEKNTKSKNPKVVNTKNGRIMLLTKFTVCDSKKFKFIKETGS